MTYDEFNLHMRIKYLFSKSRESLGSRELMKVLRKDGFTIGRYKVRSMMKKLGLIVK